MEIHEVDWYGLAGTALALIAYLVPVVLMASFVWIGRRIYYRKDRRNPITRDLLRGPGHTIAKELDDVRGDLIAYFAMATPLPLYFLAGWSLPQAMFGVPHSGFPVVYAVVLVGGGTYLGWKIVGIVKRIRELSLGLEAETAVGQELNQLLRDGFEVFHDINVNNLFNIDHVVVGRAGVFAIETKGRSKPIRKRKVEYKVQLDSERLSFPGWKETKPLQQAKRNAEWVSQWLTKATGETTVATPVLMLPGWWIDRTARTDVIVLNGANCRSAFSKLNAKSLSEEQMRRVVYQLETRCRDVAPRQVG